MSLETTHTGGAHLDWLKQKQIVIHTSDIVLCYVLCYTHTLRHKPLSHVAALLEYTLSIARTLHYAPD